MKQTTPGTEAPTERGRAQPLAFARVLVEAGALVSPRSVIDYFEAPKRHDREHQIWTQAGRPTPPSADDLAQARMLGAGSPLQQHRADTAGWNAFRHVLDAHHDRGAPLPIV